MYKKLLIFSLIKCLIPGGVFCGCWVVTPLEKKSPFRASCELWIKNRRDEGMKWQLGMTGVM